MAVIIAKVVGERMVEVERALTGVDELEESPADILLFTCFFALEALVARPEAKRAFYRVTARGDKVIGSQAPKIPLEQGISFTPKE